MELRGCCQRQAKVRWVKRQKQARQRRPSAELPAFPHGPQTQVTCIKGDRFTIF